MDALQPLRAIWSDEPRRYLLLIVLFAAFYSYAFVGGPAPVRPLGIGAAQTGGPLSVYFFHLASCPHCRAQEVFNQQLANEFPTVEWKYYDVSDDSARALMEKMVAERNTTVVGVPVTIIGNNVVNGFDENTIAPKLRAMIAAQMGNKTAAVENATGSNSAPSNDCEACKIPAAGKTILLPIFGVVSTSQTHPLLLSIMAGLGQAAGPCAIALMLFWIAMGLVSGRSREVQFTGIAFGSASALLGLLFLLKLVDPHALLGGWRPAGIVLGSFALFWGLHELSGIIRAHKRGERTEGGEPKRTASAAEKKKDTLVFGLEPLFFVGVAAACALAVPITAAAFVCAESLNAGIISATAQAPEQAVYLLIYAGVYAAAPLILFALVYLAALGRFGRWAELTARLLGVLMLIGLSAILLVWPSLLQI